MPESLNVIALISGGKDSFFSILHCIQNGHKVVALGNLYPAPTSGQGYRESPGEADDDDEHDLNSFMYQTVGHTVIPLYEKALQIPLYRQPIIGTAIQTALSYNHVGDPVDNGTSRSDLESDEAEDETESLIPLLKRIMAEHPTANAISTGAILSTYQRTRVESVALRLGLTPLGFLWKYPILPPAAQASLLEDMQSVGLDARTVKVASGGLDESFLWQNVASGPVMRRIEKSMKRFDTDGDGAVLGEGGEFETLVIDGPASLFRGRIEIEEQDRRIVTEGGGAAWLRILKAKVVMKTSESTKIECRIPSLLAPRFANVLDLLKSDEQAAGTRSPSTLAKTIPVSNKQTLLQSTSQAEQILHWTFGSEVTGQELTVTEEAASLISQIKKRLDNASLQPAHIVSTVIILRSMADFANINKVPLSPQLATYSVLTTPDLWLPLYSPQSPSTSNHLQRLPPPRLNKPNNPPHPPHPLFPGTTKESPPRPITLLLGPRKHRALLPSNLHSLPLPRAPNCLHRRPNPANSTHHDSTTRRRLQPPSRTILTASLAHRRRNERQLVDERRRLPTALFLGHECKERRACW